MHVPVQGTYGCGKDCPILIPSRLPQISCFTLSLKCFSSDSDNCPDVGVGPLVQFPHPPRAGPVLLTLLFPPQFLHPTEFCMVPYILFCVKYSCMLTAGVLCTLLFLKVYSWCIHAERCTPCPPTPSSSCSPLLFKYIFKSQLQLEFKVGKGNVWAKWTCRGR